MNQIPLISIIVPIYNVEKYLDRCIDSLLKQTYSNIDIILVDDGSTDNCPNICDSWSQKDKRVRVVHQNNKGAAAAKNTGLKEALGDLIAFCDADDYLHVDMLQIMSDCMDRTKSDIVICGVNWVTESGSVIRTEKSNNTELYQPDAMRNLLENRKIKEQVWDKLYKRQCLENILFIEKKKIDDVFWTYKVIGNAQKIAIIHDPLYYYTQRESSVMGIGYQDYWIQALEAYLLRCEYINERYPELYNDALSCLIKTCMYHMQMALNDKKKKNDKVLISELIKIIQYEKKGNIYEGQNIKQKVWLWCFVHAPVKTCLVRNTLRIGV